MLRFRSRRPKPDTSTPDSSAAQVDLVDPAELVRQAEDAEADGRYLDAIDLLRQANRVADPAVELRLVELRHRAFGEVEQAAGRSSWPPEYDDLTPTAPGPPAVTPAELSSEVLGSAVVNHGALLIRGLVDPAGVSTLVDGIDRAFDGRDAWGKDRAAATAPWFVPFVPIERHEPVDMSRHWVRAGGGVWAADSPRVMFTMLEMFGRAGLAEVITGYLGERPAISMRKCTLRRVPADLAHADWHQDGAFLGSDVRSINVWLALTDCGGDAPAPGLEYVPRRVDHVLETGTDGAYFDWSVGPGMVDQVVDTMGSEVIRPRFNAGDALLFDDLFLHRTATDPTLTEDRYAIESWFFAPSTYPSDQIPLVF